eukprot:g3562.t1
MPIPNNGGPIFTHARQGRQRQRYGEAGERLLAGCVPYRVRRDSRDDSELVEILLVTRRNGEGWVLPKGGWEDDEVNVEDAAIRETYEEAGVTGILDGPVLGLYRFQSNRRSNGISQTNCIVRVFAMKVQEQLELWPEASVRKRKWFSIEEASTLGSYPWMGHAIASLIERKDWRNHLINSGVMKSISTQNTATL